MFSDIPSIPIKFKPLFEASFEDRIAALLERRRRIAYFYDTPNTTSFRYRVLNMMQSLDAWPEGDISASWFCRKDLARMEEFIDRADALVICRSPYTAAINTMISRARCRQIPILFDCDDLVFDPIYAPILIKTLDLNLDDDHILDHWYSLLSRTNAVLRLCDRSIATNNYLADKMKKSSGHKSVSIVPNFLHKYQQEISRKLYSSKKENSFRSDGNITIGYFSGSPSHNRDFAIAVPALTRLMHDDSRINLRIVGFLKLTKSLSHYSDRIEFINLQDPFNLQRFIAEVQINIAPLQQNVFTNCKSELKYFESAIVGTTTIATPTHAFARTIEDRKSGYLAEAHEWEEKLIEARDAVDDITSYQAMADRGFEYADRNYGWDRCGQSIADIIFGDKERFEERNLISMSSVSS